MFSLKKNKDNLKLLTFLFTGILLGYFLLPYISNLNKDTEKSYKSGKNEPRYLKSFVKVPPSYPPENLDLQNISENDISSVENLLDKAGKLASDFEWFSGIENEHVFLYLTDMGNLRFTLKINNGNYEIKRGFDNSNPPTLVIPTVKQNISNLVGVLSDGELTYEEQYKVYNGIAIPALQALYNTDPLYTPWDKSSMKFDDLVHIEIPTENPIFHENKQIIIQATAVNVDGQWLVFSGLQGDPDFKISLTLDQATKLYVQGVYKAREANSIPELLDLSSRFLEFLEGTTVYVRKDHR